VAVDGSGSVLTSHDPAGGARAWSAVHLDGAAQLSGGLACPAVTFCLAVDNAGDVVTTQQPGGAGAWTVTKSGVAVPVTVGAPLGPFGATAFTACPSVAFCAVVDPAGGLATSSAGATGSPPVWAHRVIASAAAGLSGVSCASVSFCVAVSGDGHALISTSAAGGAPVWSSTRIDGDIPLTAVSCASAAICVATDAEGNAIVGRR
jgi:hypothetical protein